MSDAIPSVRRPSPQRVGDGPPAVSAWNEADGSSLWEQPFNFPPRVAIERLLASTSSISLDPHNPPQRRPSIFIRRHTTLPLVIET